MIRSMLAAVSGLRNHQTFLDVIGNNIANVNTVGFKSTRLLFSDIMSQLARGASSPQAGKAGTNPVQVGLGMQVAGTDTMQTQGNFQSTGKITDMAIEGDGFFSVYDGVSSYYTRDGSFDVATDGSIANSATGMKLQGWSANSSGTIDITRPVGDIVIPYGATMSGQPSTAATVRGNLDAGASNYYGAVTQSNPLGGAGVLSGVFSGASTSNLIVKVASVGGAGDVTGVQVSTDGGATYGAVIPAAGGAPVALGNGVSIAIATNVANIVNDTYSFAASPPTAQGNVGIYDSLGVLHSVKISFIKTAQNTWSWLPTTSEAGVTVTPATTTSFTFGATGVYTGAAPAGNISLTLTNGATTPATVTLDLSTLTQLAGNSEAHATADGASAGNLTSFSIGQSGDVEGIYTNGLSKVVGQIAIAKFSNPGGLTKLGRNLYGISANSGDAAVGVPGVGGRGLTNSGYLEMSNVDLALQFTNMIMAERGFQANSRVITASDEMLQDLVNLKR